MTFDIKGGLEAARKFLKTTKIFACAEPLGGVESLIEHPAIMTHASVPKETRELLGISDLGAHWRGAHAQLGQSPTDQR